MKKFLFLILLWCGSAYSAPYTPPTVQLSAPEKTRPGHMVVVAAVLPPGPQDTNLISTKYQWGVLVNGEPIKEFLVWPDGTKLVFSASDSPSTTTVVLNVNFEFGTQKVVTIDGKEQKVFTDVTSLSSDLLLKSITVGDPAPTPTPTPPIPTPTPTPPLPPDPSVLPVGKYDLANYTYKALAGDQLMGQAEKAALAKELAKSFKTVAQNIPALASYPKNRDAILTDLKTRNEAAIGESGVDYAKTVNFKKALGDIVYDLVYVKKTISSAEDVGTACREIAAGLDAVKTGGDQWPK